MVTFIVIIDLRERELMFNSLEKLLVPEAWIMKSLANETKTTCDSGKSTRSNAWAGLVSYLPISSLLLFSKITFILSWVHLSDEPSLQLW